MIFQGPTRGRQIHPDATRDTKLAVEVKSGLDFGFARARLSIIAHDLIVCNLYSKVWSGALWCGTPQTESIPVCG